MLAAIAEYNKEVITNYTSRKPIGDFETIFGRNEGYNVGAYASAAGFSFLVAILYIVQAGFVVKKMLSMKVMS